jgi:hypothetical protein
MTSVPVKVGSTVLLAALVLGSGIGCAPDVVDEDSVGSQSEALTSTDYVDSTGFVHIRVKVCDFGASSHIPFSFCAVDAGFVLVGGGAEVEGSASGGGILIESFPSGSSWVARSKDHVTSYLHRIRAYSVGMSLTGMSAATLGTLVKLTVATSGVSNRPSVSVNVPAGHILLSGGALVGYNGAGLLLTGSYPSGDFQWTVTAKDHQVADTGLVQAYVISIPVCLNNVLPRCLITSVQATSAFVPTGYGVASLNTPPGYAPLGVGGRANWSGQGRLLTDIFPSNSVGGAGATAYSKDHKVAEGNSTDVWALSIQGF